ncbi:MAG: T9SS type A sorting domain-containing protein [Vicingaceae bacterium]
MDFKIRNAPNHLLDSSSFYFEISDITLSKSHNSLPTSTTGPRFFQDSNLNQAGGFATGDRFGTLYEKNRVSSWRQRNVPTSRSLYIDSDTSNMGKEFDPKIWQATLDSSQISLIVGNVDATAFIPTTIDSFMLGSELTLIFDNGTAVFSGLTEGKYIVGFESTLPNPNGKSLILGRDTIGENLQPMGSSFVYFGHNTNRYGIYDLPMIGLNFGNALGTAYIRPCITVGIEEEFEKFVDFQIYPNPSNGKYTVEKRASIQTIAVYNINGQKVNVELTNNLLDLSEHPRGIYLLRARLENGEVVSKS